MNQMYLLQNQHKLFLSKQSQWLDGRDLGSLYKARHKDEALNRLFEVNAKDFSQRIHLLECSPKPNGLPLIDPAQLPPPMVKPSPAQVSPELVDGAVGGAADTTQPELSITED